MVDMHEHKDRGLVDAMSSAEGARTEPLEIEIANPDQEQQDAEGRAAADQEQAQADEDAGRAALEMLHGDGEDE